MGNKWSFRFATLADVTDLHTLVESAYRGEQARRGWTHEADLLDGQRTDADALTEAIADAEQRIVLMFEGDTLLGCVQVRLKGGGRASLGMLAVTPTRQTGGLGKQLIAAAEACARDVFDCHVMEMSVIKQRTELIAYYARRGYGTTGREEPFPLADPRAGLPRTRELVFLVLQKNIRT